MLQGISGQAQGICEGADQPPRHAIILSIGNPLVQNHFLLGQMPITAVTKPRIPMTQFHT